MNRFGYSRSLGLALASVIAAAWVLASAEALAVSAYAISRQWQWEMWTYPEGAVKFEEDGSVKLGSSNGEGYPAQVELTSSLIDFESSRIFASVEWEADTPPGTEVKIWSRTGPDGTPGPDWSEWSRAYRFSGERFLSPSPRRFVQLKVGLSTEDPQVTPVLRRVLLFYHDPLVSGGIEGTIFPREVESGELEEFTYTVVPYYYGDPSDTGFDRLGILVPSEVEKEVSVEVGGMQVAVSSAQAGDTLWVALPQVVRGDSVVVRFKATVFEDETGFEGTALHSGRPGISQKIEPSEPDALKVYVSSVGVEPSSWGAIKVMFRVR